MVRMNRWRYRGVLRITAAADALYLSVATTMRIGHPPLSIPWNEIAFSRTSFLFTRFVVLTLGREERIPLRIPESAARKLGILERMPGENGASAVLAGSVPGTHD